MTCEPKTIGDILDLIDIQKYMHKNIELHDLMHYLSAAYAESELVNNDICEGELFNNMDDFEFEQYLRKRYKNLGFYNYTNTYLTWQ